MKPCAFEAYCLYIAIRTHFNEKHYNFQTYNGNIRTKSKEDFDKQKDRLYFNKLGIKYGDRLKSFFIANLFHDPTVWVGELVKQKHEDRLLEFEKYEANMLYYFERDLVTLSMHYRRKTLFAYEEGRVPSILQALISEEIHPLTFMILDRIVGIKDNWKGIEEKLPIWEKYSLRIDKLSFFYSLKNQKDYLDIMVKVLKPDVDKAPAA